MADRAQLNSSEHTHACVCVCVHMCACLHTRAGEPVCPGWGEGATVAPTLHVPASQRVAECRGHVCPRVHTPRAGPCSSSRLLPPGAAADSGRRGGAGQPRPCSPERWPGQGGRPGPGQRAGGGRGGLWSAPRASCPASGRDFGRKVGLIRKALPGEVGLPEAESASPGVHANPLPLPPPGASSTAAVPRLAPEAGRVEREHPASACGLCPWAQTRHLRASWWCQALSTSPSTSQLSRCLGTPADMPPQVLTALRSG